MENRYLIVGLGNPGADYKKTRHNAGFLLADYLARRWQAAWELEKKFNSRIARGAVLGSKVLLGQPQTYMNLSGEAVRALVDYYRIPRSRVLLLVDDADLPLGEIRLRGKGSSGGHHGLESIEHQLGSRDYARLRLGIGRQSSEERQIKDYVLGRFTAAEFKFLECVLARAAEQVDCWLTAGIEMAMTKFNGLIKNTETKDFQ